MVLVMMVTMVLVMMVATTRVNGFSRIWTKTEVQKPTLKIVSEPQFPLYRSISTLILYNIIKL